MESYYFLYINLVTPKLSGIVLVRKWQTIKNASNTTKKREMVLLYYHYYTHICLYDYGAILNKMHVFGGLLFQKKNTL